MQQFENQRSQDSGKIDQKTVALRRKRKGGTSGYFYQFLGNAETFARNENVWNNEEWWKGRISEIHINFLLKTKQNKTKQNKSKPFHFPSINY